MEHWSLPLHVHGLTSLSSSVGIPDMAFALLERSSEGHLDSSRNGERTLTSPCPMNNMGIRGTASVQDTDTHQGNPCNA